MQGGILPKVIIVLLLGALAGILVWSTGFFQKGARDSDREAMVKRIAVSLEDYYAENEHYPTVGDPIPGGAVISGNDNFNSVMAALVQGKFIAKKVLSDPLYGSIFGEFNGGDAFLEGVKFNETSGKCQGNMVLRQSDTTGVVSYAYFTPDRNSYIMCLVLEDGKTKVFVNPKEI